SGKPPYQFKLWVYYRTMLMVAQDWSASPTFAWTPSAANAAAQLSTWVRSSANLTDTYESFKLTSFAITPLTQVRFLNNLLICNRSEERRVGNAFTVRAPADQPP